MSRKASALVVILLAGCSGGDGGGTGSSVPVVTAPTPTPTPAPTPTPTPTPTAAIAYPTYDQLTANRRFLPICDRVTYAFDYTVAGPTWTIVRPATEATQAVFGPANVDPSVTDAVIAYARANTRGGTDRFVIRRPVVAGKAFDYIRSATTDILGQGDLSRISQACLFGVPTVPLDVPTTGMQVYDLAVEGSVTLTGASSASSLSRSTIRITINYVNRFVQVDARFVATSSSGTDTVLATTDSTTRLAADNSFSVSLLIAGTEGSYTGSISGNLFGPQGKEVGTFFSLGGPTGRNDYTGRGSGLGMR